MESVTENVCPYCDERFRQGAQGIRLRLIEDAGRKPVRRVVQFDGFADIEGDDVMRPDADGDCLMSSDSYELYRSGLPVRVWVNPEASKDTALRLIRKIASWLERYEWPPKDETPGVTAHLTRIGDGRNPSYPRDPFEF